MTASRGSQATKPNRRRQPPQWASMLQVNKYEETGLSANVCLASLAGTANRSAGDAQPPRSRATPRSVNSTTVPIGETRRSAQLSSLQLSEPPQSR